MGKGFKGKLCVYCLQRDSEDGDHVVSRKFFLPGNRENLPKVPACKQCNNEKSKLEHYLTTVLPFGGRHVHAGRTLAEMTPPRLAKNNKLRHTIALGLKREFVLSNGGPWVPCMTIPIDAGAVERLFEFVVKGLAWHHWKLNLDAEHFVRVAFLTEKGRTIFQWLLAMGTRDRVQGNLGDGVFEYEGVQAKECPELTVWRMSLYRAEVAGGPQTPWERCSSAYGITAPKRWPAAVKFVAMMG